MAVMKNYRAQDVALVFGVPITGFAEGSFIKVSRNEEAFKYTPGVGKTGCRSATQNKSGRIEFTLLQSSLSNDYLSGLHNVDQETGDGILPALMKDLSGTSIHAAENAWIVKFPDAEQAVEVTNRVWILECDELLMNVGGNLA